MAKSSPSIWHYGVSVKLTVDKNSIKMFTKSSMPLIWENYFESQNCAIFHLQYKKRTKDLDFLKTFLWTFGLPYSPTMLDELRILTEVTLYYISWCCLLDVHRGCINHTYSDCHFLPYIKSNVKEILISTIGFRNQIGDAQTNRSEILSKKLSE